MMTPHHLFLRRAGAGVLPGREVFQIDRNAPPETVETVVVEGAQELALGDALAFEGVAHRGARGDVVDHVVGAVDAFVEAFPVGQERSVVGLDRSREVGVVEVDHGVRRVHDRRECVPVEARAGAVDIVVEDVAVSADARPIRPAWWSRTPCRS